MPLPRRRTALAAAFLVAFCLTLASSIHAQTRNPYYELQCSLSGAYCDRVYAAPERPETFDELLERKERERARAQQERDASIARHRAQLEHERQVREERARQAQAARAQLTADRIQAAPAWIRWFRAAWPVPQWTAAGLLLSFAAVAYIGRREFSAAPGPGFFILLGLSLIGLPFTYGASAYNDPASALFTALFPFIAFLALNGLHVLRGWHHLFVSHPATRVAGPLLREGALFPRDQLAAALRPDPAQLFEHPPAYQSRDLKEKAYALRDKIDADAEITAAAMRRDRARAAKMQADAELRAARKKLPWRQRWMWW
jgi:hypothetical protein